jgi:hypothetical protein
MVHHILPLFIFLLLSIGSIKAQIYQGKVLDGNNVPIADASIAWKQRVSPISESSHPMLDVHMIRLTRSSTAKINCN